VFPQRWQLTEASFLHLLRLVKVGSVSMLEFRAKKIPYVQLPRDALTLTLQENKEDSLHGIAADASDSCIILLLTENFPDLLPECRQSQLVSKGAQPAAVVGLVPKLVAGSVKGQDLQYRLCM
jgi:hypothetical protein